MSREKEFFQDNLELLNIRFPDHDMLTFEEVKQVMGWTDTKTLKKYLGKHIVNERVCKPALARYMSG